MIFGMKVSYACGGLSLHESDIGDLNCDFRKIKNILEQKQSAYPFVVQCFVSKNKLFHQCILSEFIYKEILVSSIWWIAKSMRVQCFVQFFAFKSMILHCFVQFIFLGQWRFMVLFIVAIGGIQELYLKLSLWAFLRNVFCVQKSW